LSLFSAAKKPLLQRRTFSIYENKKDQPLKKKALGRVARKTRHHPSLVGTIVSLYTLEVAGNGRAPGSCSLILVHIMGGIRHSSLWRGLLILVKDGKPFQRRKFSFIPIFSVSMFKASCLINIDSSNLCNLYAQTMQPPLSPSISISISFPLNFIQIQFPQYTFLSPSLYPCSSLSPFPSKNPSSSSLKGSLSRDATAPVSTVLQSLSWVCFVSSWMRPASAARGVDHCRWDPPRSQQPRQTCTNYGSVSEETCVQISTQHDVG
jgi:hypothetical protein